MIFRPTFRRAGTIYHYLANFTLRPPSLQRRADRRDTPRWQLTKQSCLFTLTRPSICKLLSNSAHPPVTVASFDQVLATRESFESIARELDSYNFSFRRVVKKVTERTPIPSVLLFRLSRYTRRISKKRKRTVYPRNSVSKCNSFTHKIIFLRLSSRNMGSPPRVLMKCHKANKLLRHDPAVVRTRLGDTTREP